MLDRRLQILIDEDRHRRLSARARSRGVPVAHLVRDAIDQYFESEDERRRAAAASILAAPKMTVPEPDELRKELDELRSGGL